MVLTLLLLMALISVGVSFSNPGEYIGVGYNLLTGNPDGDNLHSGGIDPGLLVTRKVLKISPGSSPPEVIQEQRHSCTRLEETHVFYGTKSYQNRLKTGVSFGGSGLVELVKFAFSLSGRYSKISESTQKHQEVFLDDQQTCNLGRLRYADELVASHKFSVSDNFAADVCALPAKYDLAKYSGFFDKWGTHVTMEADLGTKVIHRYSSSLKEFVQHVQKVSGTDVSLGGSYMGYGASLGVNFEKFKDSAAYSKKFGSSLYTLETGTDKLPEPIKLTLNSIDSVLNSKYWQNLSGFKQHHVCGSGVDLHTISTKGTNMRTALEHYGEYKRAHPATDQSLKWPVTWPKGTYGLLKAKTGCPGNKVTWHEGWRNEDMENTFTHNHVSHPLDLAGNFGHDFRFEFCMKGDATTSQFDADWPAGEYCILKYGKCPTGFSEGWFQWHDELVRNHNGIGGSHPDGTYGKNTKVYFCCRADSLPTHAIVLPTSKPFFLLRYRRECQHVHGMNVREEWIQSDTELMFGKNHAGGAHPLIQGHDPRTHMCYYWPSGNHSPVIVG